MNDGDREDKSHRNKNSTFDAIDRQHPIIQRKFYGDKVPFGLNYNPNSNFIRPKHESNVKLVNPNDLTHPKELPDNVPDCVRLQNRFKKEACTYETRVMVREIKAKGGKIPTTEAELA